MSSDQTALEEPKRKVDQGIGVAGWFTVTQEEVEVFARVTDDIDPIHNDPEWASQGPYGATITNGFSTLSSLGKFSREFAKDQQPTYQERRTPVHARPTAPESCWSLGRINALSRKCKYCPRVSTGYQNSLNPRFSAIPPRCSERWYDSYPCASLRLRRPVLSAWLPSR